MSVDLPHAAIGIAVAGFELFGVGVITLGSLLACGRFAFLHTKVGMTARYHALRQELGGTIVLGLSSSWPRTSSAPSTSIPRSRAWRSLR